MPRKAFYPAFQGSAGPFPLHCLAATRLRRALPIGARLDFKYPFDSHFIKPGKDVPGHSQNTGGHLQSPHTYAGSARGRLRLPLADYLLHFGFAFSN